MTIRANDKGILKPVPEPRFTPLGPEPSAFWQTVLGLAMVTFAFLYGIGFFLIFYHTR